MSGASDAFAREKVLVVGGAGFVGGNLCRMLLQGDVRELWIVDNLLSADITNVPDDGRVRFMLGSIADDAILQRLPRDLDVIFHLACYHGNQSSIANPLADHANNTLTTLKLFDWTKDFANLNKVVYAAAGCAVAEKTFSSAQATAEDAPVSLFHDSPYSISKLVGELYANFYFSRYHFPVVKARFQNVYGPGEILGAGQWRGTPATVWRNVTPTFVYRALKQLPLTVENGGVATRDFIYVEDIVRGLVLCAVAGKPGDVYNLASGVETSILELAKLVNGLTGSPAPLDFRPPRAWDHSGKRFGSTEKAKRMLGFEAGTMLREGLERTIVWTREHLPLIDRCIRQHADRISPC